MHPLFGLKLLKRPRSQTSVRTADSGWFFQRYYELDQSVTDAVNKMWGMENGSGVAMVVNAAFYLILIVGVLFFGKMIFNILSSAIIRQS